MFPFYSSSVFWFFWSHSISRSSPPLQTVELKAVCEENVFWRIGVRKHVNWWFDCAAVMVSTEDRGEGEICTVSPSSGSLGPGQFICLSISISPEAIRTGEKWLETHTHTRYDWLLYLSMLYPFSHIQSHIRKYSGSLITPLQLISLDPSLPHTHMSGDNLDNTQHKSLLNRVKPPSEYIVT